MSGRAPGGGDLVRLLHRAQPGVAGRGGPRLAMLDRHRLLRQERGEVWHPASKILAEKASWKFVEENGLDVVVVNPWTVLDPMIPPRINASTAMFLCLLEGCTEEYKDFFIGSVHVEDVALTHIMMFENPTAFGRHLCVEPMCHWGDFASKVGELYPDYKVPNKQHTLNTYFTCLEHNNFIANNDMNGLLSRC